MSGLMKKYFALAAGLLVVTAVAVLVLGTSWLHLTAAAVLVSITGQIVLAVHVLMKHMSRSSQTAAKTVEEARSRLDWRITYEQGVAYRSLKKSIEQVSASGKALTSLADETKRVVQQGNSRNVRLENSLNSMSNQLGVLRDMSVELLAGHDARLPGTPRTSDGQPDDGPAS